MPNEILKPDVGVMTRVSAALHAEWLRLAGVTNKQGTGKKFPYGYLQSFMLTAVEQEVVRLRKSQNSKPATDLTSLDLDLSTELDEDDLALLQGLDVSKSKGANNE